MNSNHVQNFLDPTFETKIKCSCTVDDFHDVENLITNDVRKSARGFMAYRVVKPPVELEFQLCCTIELCAIKIWPKIDSLKSTGFEVYAKGDSARSEYQKVASHFNLKENGIHFVNDSVTNIENTNIGHDFAVKPFYFSTKNHLRKVKTIKLIIKQTAKCVPVLKRIEIWGRISSFASEEQRANVYKTIMKMNASIDECNEAIDHSDIDTNGADSPVESDNKNITLSMAVPESFLDAITYEIMALPMVLPSGKVIDSSTLLKHTVHEEKWGRVPSDPFTGRPYTESRKPILDVQLKSQIDSFLLKHCDTPDIRNTARTVGPISKRRKLTATYECESRDLKWIKTELSSNSEKDENPSRMTTETSTTTTTQLLTSTSERKSQSLDEAIRGVLKVGKYTAASYRNLSNDISINNCFQCCGSINNMMYIITTCSHLICRNCLIDKNLNICKCGNAFNNTNINKYH